LSEIVSQLLFGDGVAILEKTDKWLYIRHLNDGYEGWIDFKQVISADNHPITHLAPPQVQNILVAADGSKYYLPAGSSLPNYADGFCTVGTARFKVEFEPLKVDFNHPTGDVKELAMFYLNAPYLWGGRTLFGIDCSGFVQSVYRMRGVQLRRDASQQAEQGSTVDFLVEAQCGDLAFFDNAEGRIIHVGMLLNNHEIIHSSGKVRIDPVDDQGIFNKELQKYTHQLRIIKRF
jgi:hypothetical protein